MRTMAWRPTDYLIEGILDNSVQGKVTGWMKFAGLNENVVFNLEGNFHRDIRGAKVRLRGEGEIANAQQATAYMQDFSFLQKGKVGDITGGFEPADYVQDSVYIEWYSADNGRCVIELEQDQIELLTQPIPAMESDPNDRKQQAENMAEFLCGMAEAVGIPTETAVATGNTVAVERAKKVLANDKLRGMKLLPKEIREVLGDVHHARVLVHDDHAAGAHHRTGFRQAVEIDGQVGQRRGDAATGRASGLNGLQGLVVLHSPADVFNNLPQSDAHGDFHQPGVLALTDHREDLGPLAALAPDGGVFLRPHLHDDRHVGPRLDVVQSGRTFPKAAFDGVDVLGTRLTHLSLQ